MQNKESKLKYVFLDSPAIDLVNELRKKLIEHNSQMVSNYKSNDYFLGYYDKNNNLAAGLFAKASVGKFCIDLLWVDESLRNHGLGSKLLKNLEEIAIKKQAIYIRLNTYSFLAPEFYIKNGYEILAKLPILADDKKNQYDYFFIKYLNANCMTF